MTTFRAGWYVIYTKPRHEKKVNARLAENHIHSFLPTRKTLRVWHDRKKIVDEPLFPSYIFIYLDNMQSYYRGADAEGALYYVRTGKEIARVGETVVNNIKLISGQADDIEISDNRFQPGRQLVISQGPLTGLSCEVVETSGNCRLLVRVELLQRSILLKLPEESLMTI
ncbi:antitermination protein NusG [Niastella yeongjuensis]|uniref:Antitermination protein NusG n=1 Tax=Niastella yeongjuensis TaxID=354355 RepID=A0A1V9EI99_9BACT|nr:UpxY family transcription antiterminator [Niastella yeongjuensis]OQP45859.1 antitermination protein NusG [Niastella yeongjuensis]SEP46667.1 Transcription antitermination factor NusG [Niastella yeongjuensis]